MAIITTKNSNRESYLTFLNTYPSSASSLNLNSTGGYTTDDYTDTYWRPTDSSSNTSKVNVDGSNIELGFNVKWGNIQTSGTNKGKVAVRVSLMLSEQKYWLNVTYKPSTVSATTLIRGYNYKFSVAGTSYTPDAPIIEVVNGNNNSPDFSQTVSGVTKNYTFRSSNSSSTRTYITEHSTEIWNNTFYVTPNNGKASITVNVTNLYLHWRDIYGKGTPNIWVGNASKTFTSSKSYYTTSVSINPSNMNITLYPKTADIVLINNGSKTTGRAFWNYVDHDKTIVTDIQPNITAYKDTTTNHKITITNNDSGTSLGNVAWTSSNSNAIKVTPTSNSNFTNASFNGKAVNCKVTFNAMQANIQKTCNFNFTKNTNRTYSINNTNIATVTNNNGKYEVKLKRGMNGSVNLTTTFNGGLKVNTTLSSYLVANNINFYCYNSNNVQTTTINYGETLRLRAKVSPYSSNTYTSVVNNSEFRKISFSATNGTVSNSVANSTIPYYEATYTAPTTGSSTQYVTINAYQPYTSSSTGVHNSKVITINPKSADTLPTMQLTVKSITPNPVADGASCLVTYELSSLGRALTTDEKNYLNNLSLTYSGTTYIGTNYKTVSSVNTSGTDFTITNPKRQCVYYVEITENTSGESILDWQPKASITLPTNIYSSTPGQTVIAQPTYKVSSKYLNIIPSNVILNVGEMKQISYKYNTQLTDGYYYNAFMENPYSAIVEVTNFTRYGDDEHRYAGHGTFNVTGISTGKTSAKVKVRRTIGTESYVLENTCNIYVVDNNLLDNSIIYPYVYTVNTEKKFDSIRYQDKETLRTIFKLPNYEMFKIISDIKVIVNYDNNIDVTYSLLNNPECFSIMYPRSTNGISDDFGSLYEILKLYTIYVNTNGIEVTVVKNNVYDVEDVQTGDKLIGYKPNIPYSLANYINAYKSFTQGYITNTNINNLITLYGRNICGLNHFGESGSPISIEPFYKFLLSQNYIRNIDKYFASRYYDVSAKIKVNVDVDSNNNMTIIESLYPNDIRNAYTTEDQITKYNLRDTNNKNLNPFYIPYMEGNLASDGEENYPISADDSKDYYYDNSDFVNDYKTTTYYANFTISPLKEFTSKVLDVNQKYSNVQYEVKEPIVDPTELPLPIMTNIFAIYTAGTFNTTPIASNTYVWKNLLNNKIYPIIIKGNTSVSKSGNIIGFSKDNYGIIDCVESLNSYTIYIAAKSDSAVTIDDTSTIITFISSFKWDLDGNKRGISLGNYGTISLSQSSTISYNYAHNKQINVTDGNMLSFAYNTSQVILNQPHVYAVSVASNGDVSLYVEIVIMLKINPMDILL